MTFTKQVLYSKEDKQFFTLQFVRTSLVEYFRYYFFGSLPLLIFSDLITKPNIMTLFSFVIFVIMLFPKFLATIIRIILGKRQIPSKTLTYSVNDTFFKVQFGDISTQVNWKGFTGRIIDKKYVYLYIGDRPYMLPKRLFLQDEWNEFIHFISITIQDKKMPSLKYKILWFLIGCLPWTMILLSQ